MVPKDLIEPSVPLGAKLTVEGSTPELLKFDAGVRSGNRALGLDPRPSKSGLPPTAFVAQVANISVTSCAAPTRSWAR